MTTSIDTISHRLSAASEKILLNLAYRHGTDVWPTCGFISLPPTAYPFKFTFSMTPYSSTAATDLTKLNEGEPSRRSQHSRFVRFILSMYYQLSKTRPIRNSTHSPLIHILDDDSLLYIFYLSRLAMLSDIEVDDNYSLSGLEWDREWWWYKIVQVCRRWRFLVLESASHLQVSLVCARGTPVAEMLAHYPSLPLIIDFFDHKYHDFTAKDEEGIKLALKHRDRVRCIRLMKPISVLQKIIIALDGEFPILEYLKVQQQRFHRPLLKNIPNLNLPNAFRAPHLRQLFLKNFSTPIDSLPLLTMENLNTLLLNTIPSSAYFHPNALLQRLPLLPQLEILWIGFSFDNSSRDAERKLLRTPIMTWVTLPNLRWLGFRGSNAYLEALLPGITTPLLKKFQVYFLNRTIYSIPNLQEFMSTARNLHFNTTTFIFSADCLIVKAYPHKGDKLYNFTMELGGRHLDSQVVSAAQVFHALRTLCLAVEHLVFEYDSPNVSSEWNREADCTRWREFLGLFGNAKTLSVDGELVGQLSSALQPGEGESSAELLSELQELSYSATASSLTVFTPFIDARQKAGRPVTVVHP